MGGRYEEFAHFLVNNDMAVIVPDHQGLEKPLQQKMSPGILGGMAAGKKY